MKATSSATSPTRSSVGGASRCCMLLSAQPSSLRLMLGEASLGLNRFSGNLCYNWTVEPVVTINPKVMHGESCFAGTRVAAQTLVDHLEAGYDVDEVLGRRPSGERQRGVGSVGRRRGQGEWGDSSGRRAERA